MILIADSGSTKTEWYVTDSGIPDQTIITSGINPVLQDKQEIRRILETELLPQIHAASTAVKQIYFYGAGCTPENVPLVTSALSHTFTQASTVFAGSDLLGAAHALCGNSTGIVCILGTGSNSCLYDGERIVEQVSPLGFILGDEGSGAYIGKRLVGDVLKHQLPEELCRLFLEHTRLTVAEIIRKVYREPMPNRFLASLSRFCHENRSHPAMHKLLVDCFNEFFKRNVMTYRHGKTDGDESKINFVGSVAYYYIEEIKEAAAMNGLCIGKVVRNPIKDMAAYRLRTCSV
ncbi:MAG: ATPase [Bacteroides sp.]|nr:ATPase [Bacteroides sp.]MCM1420382.1 ATPase [Bacteroides sp.]